MEIEFYVQNVKCSGCVNAIQTGLGKDPHVQAVQVDIPTGKVVVTSDADIRAELSAALKQLGYPEKAA
jgi:copper chaperone